MPGCILRPSRLVFRLEKSRGSVRTLHCFVQLVCDEGKIWEQYVLIMKRTFSDQSTPLLYLLA